MISFDIEGCRIDVLPIIKGLISESEKVASALENDYDCIAVALSIEEIETLKKMDSFEWEYDPTNLDSVYSHHLKKYGEVNVPVPAFKTAVDICESKSKGVLPLDMCDASFTEMYCECVSTFDMLKENRILKKSMKTTFDESSPEAFVKEWDALINEIKGQRLVSKKREEYIAEQLMDISKYRKHALAIIEYERVEGILDILGVRQ